MSCNRTTNLCELAVESDTCFNIGLLLLDIFLSIVPEKAAQRFARANLSLNSREDIGHRVR